MESKRRRELQEASNKVRLTPNVLSHTELILPYASSYPFPVTELISSYCLSLSRFLSFSVSLCPTLCSALSACVRMWGMRADGGDGEWSGIL